MRFSSATSLAFLIQVSPGLIPRVWKRLMMVPYGDYQTLAEITMGCTNVEPIILVMWTTKWLILLYNVSQSVYCKYLRSKVGKL